MMVSILTPVQLVLRFATTLSICRLPTMPMRLGKALATIHGQEHNYLDGGGCTINFAAQSLGGPDAAAYVRQQ